jgi:hypothetical protein
MSGAQRASLQRRRVPTRHATGKLTGNLRAPWPSLVGRVSGLAMAWKTSRKSEVGRLPRPGLAPKVTAGPACRLEGTATVSRSARDQFAERLRTVLEQAGLSQAVLVRKLRVAGFDRVGEPRVSEWCHGRALPRDEAVVLAIQSLVAAAGAAVPTVSWSPCTGRRAASWNPRGGRRRCPGSCPPPPGGSTASCAFALDGMPPGQEAARRISTASCARTSRTGRPRHRGVLEPAWPHRQPGRRRANSSEPPRFGDLRLACPRSVRTRLSDTRALIGPVQVRRGPDRVRQDSFH